jgi:hypothetical protein
MTRAQSPRQGIQANQLSAWCAQARSWGQKHREESSKAPGPSRFLLRSGRGVAAWRAEWCQARIERRTENRASWTKTQAGGAGSMELPRESGNLLEAQMFLPKCCRIKLSLAKSLLAYFSGPGIWGFKV